MGVNTGSFFFSSETHNYGGKHRVNFFPSEIHMEVDTRTKQQCGETLGDLEPVNNLFAISSKITQAEAVT